MGSHIAIALGDPAGIGLEITQKALTSFERASFKVTAFGCSQALNILGDHVDFVCVGDFEGPMAKASAESGELSYQSFSQALDFVREGRAQALVTAPISKEAWHMAGRHYPGHTEVLRERCARADAPMAFFGERLKVVLSTTHIPLREVSSNLSVEKVVSVSEALHEALRPLLLGKKPRLAMAALNPHASEEGLFGDEEQSVLKPALGRLRERGIDISDPIPADAVFRLAVRGDFDGVVAHYHDQALIPVKLVDFGVSANITLGLPIVRTSPDHGTAFDIAGQNKADAQGMLAAIRWALALSQQ